MKVRTFVLNDTITPRRIKQLISRIELCKAKNINLYLSSKGGEVAMADIFTDFTHKTDKKIHFIGCEMMASCCVNIFLESKGRKSIRKHTCALLHYVTVLHESRNFLNKKSYESAMIMEIKKENEDRLKRYSYFFNLTDKEKSILKNGGDLGIDYERLKKALPKINRNKFI